MAKSMKTMKGPGKKGNKGPVKIEAPGATKGGKYAKTKKDAKK